MPATPKISPSLVNLLLYGTGERRRYTHDTPILLDVWQQVAADPAARHDLLITPLDSLSSVRLLTELARRLTPEAVRASRPAPLQSFVAIALTFVDLIGVLSMTQWARDAVQQFRTRARDPDWRLDGATAFDQVLRSAEGRPLSREVGSLRGALFDAARVLTLIAVIDVASRIPDLSFDKPDDLPPHEVEIVAKIEALAAMLSMFGGQPAQVWRVSRNRGLENATAYSRATTKADAAYRVFDVKCETITWAVIDAGIDCSHPAFRIDPNDPKSRSRIEKTYDLGLLRDLLDATYIGRAKENPHLKQAADRAGLKLREAIRHLRNVHQSYDTDVLDWSSIEPLLTVAKPALPIDGHGTHVAGIIGGNWPEEKIIGMCPDIRMMDFRILSGSADDTEFAVIGALQLVRYLNSHNRHIVIHGVNLSLSIPHQVENYACGRTPVCDECERLVASGVTVVAAAGNQGYQKFHTEKGLFANYSSFSITDPGNAESVITVGATHRRQPHTYGISYFSSRGPTGDGRMKPDLVAPGERIVSALPDGEYGALDGTSQAAPHVSGAAAMIMARYPEINREPKRIKQLLCDNATALGRERSFEGHGLLDVLRALQAF